MFARLKTRFAIWRRYRETVMRLGRLNEHMLADVGIARDDIKAIAKARREEQWS